MKRSWLLACLLSATATDCTTDASCPASPRHDVGGSSLLQRSSLRVQQSSDLLAKVPNDDNLDDFFLAGEGSCTDIYGQSTACEWADHTALCNSSSPDCERSCKTSETCSGYVLREDGRCCLITQSSPLPSAGDGVPGHKCYWRHTFLQDSSPLPQQQLLQPVPPIIWSFWRKPDPGQPLNPLIAACIDSWRSLNPDFTIRVLNDTSLGDWLLPSDLPATYSDLCVQGQSDAIRFALLDKYGGYWLDASVLLLQPLVNITAGAPRTFFFYEMPGTPHLKEQRMPLRRIPSWFLTAAPGDLFIRRCRECFQSLHSQEHPSNQPLGRTGVFSTRVLEEIQSLAIDVYLGSYACFLQVLEEDRGLDRLWKSKELRHISAREAGLRLFENKTASWAGSQCLTSLAFQKDMDLLESLKASDNFVMKFPTFLRGPLEQLSAEQLRCSNTTMSVLLESIGVNCDRTEH